MFIPVRSSQPAKKHVMVLEVDQKRRISLGRYATIHGAFAAAHPVGGDIEGEIKNITEFGLFVASWRNRRHGAFVRPVDANGEETVNMEKG